MINLHMYKWLTVSNWQACLLYVASARDIEILFYLFVKIGTLSWGDFYDSEISQVGRIQVRISVLFLQP